MKIRNIGITMTGLALALTLGLAGCGSQGDSSTGDSADETAASGTTVDVSAATIDSFTAAITSEDGQQTTLAEVANNRPLVVNFWATWCPYCIQELPDFQEVKGEYSDRVAFAFVDAGETEEEVKQFLQENTSLDLPIYYDFSNELQGQFGIYAYPTTVVFSADGKVSSVTAGAIDAQQMRAQIDAVL